MYVSIRCRVAQLIVNGAVVELSRPISSYT